MVGRMIFKQKVSQVWFFDFIVASIIFFSVFSISFKIMSVNSPQNWAFGSISREANIFQYTLLSKGDPVNWTLSDVNLIGLLNNDYSLNYTKLAYFYNISNSGNESYIGSKIGIYSKYAVLFYSPNGSLIGFDFNSSTANKIYYIGYPSFDYENISNFSESVDNLVAKSNVIHNRTSLIQMKVFLWR